MSRTTERIIVELAAPQCGLVTRRQLLAGGVSSRSIEGRLASGRLRRVRAGVYASGAALGEGEREMVALLSCGDGAVLSHTTAAALLGIRAQPRASNPVEVSTSNGGCRSSRDVRVHRVSSLPPDEITVVRGLPVTTPSRTLLDLSSCLPGAAFERALTLAIRERIVTPTQLQALLRR